MRVETPQEVCQTSSCLPSLERYWVLKALAKFGAELVARAHLEGLAVAHHPFEGEGVDGSGEALLGGLAAEHHVDAEHVDHEVGVDVAVDARGVVAGVLVGGVGGVPLLPQEFARTEEDARAHLPTDHVGPLVDEQRQVAVALDPLREVLVDDRLGGRADHDGLFELLAATVRDHRELGCEALDVLSFASQVRLGDEEREVGVLGARVLDARVHLLLHPLPQAVAVRSDHHGAAHRTVVREFGLVDQILVPAGKVFRPGRENGCLCHGANGTAQGWRSVNRLPAAPVRTCRGCRGSFRSLPPPSGRGAGCGVPWHTGEVRTDIHGGCQSGHS